MNARVHCIAPQSIDSGRTALHLTTDETRRASQFHFPEDARHWSACRAALRIVLGRELGLPPREVPIVLSPLGKPLLAPPFEHLHFNLSHCPGFALLVLGNSGPLGIDLEPASRAPDLLDCEDSFCHPDEIAGLPRDPEKRAIALLRIWTAKEAVLKAMGTGLSHPPEAVRIDFSTDPATAASRIPLPELSGQRIHRLQLPGFDEYMAALSVPPAVTRIDIIPPALSTGTEFSSTHPPSAFPAHG